MAAVKRAHGGIWEVIARRVRAFREMRRLSQEELSARTGMTQQALSGLERAQDKLSLETLDVVARELGVSLATLLEDEAADDLEQLVQRARRVLALLSEDDARTMVQIMEAFAAARQAAPKGGDVTTPSAPGRGRHQ